MRRCGKSCDTGVAVRGCTSMNFKTLVCPRLLRPFVWLLRVSSSFGPSCCVGGCGREHCLGRASCDGKCLCRSVVRESLVLQWFLRCGCGLRCARIACSRLVWWSVRETVGKQLKTPSPHLDGQSPRAIGGPTSVVHSQEEQPEEGRLQDTWRNRML